MSKRKQPTNLMLKRKVWPNSNVTSTTYVILQTGNLFARKLNGDCGTPDVDDIQVNERRRSSKNKREETTTKSQTGHCQISVGAQDFCVIENDNWRMLEGGGVGSLLLLKLSNLIPIAVKHFDIWSGWFRFFFVFLKHFLFMGREETKEKVTSFTRRGMTEDDWLQWRKQGRAKQILFIYRRQDFS